MTTILLVSAVALLIWQNKKLADQIRAITARQDEAEQSISRLSQKTRKATVQQRRFDRRLQQQRQKRERLAKQQQQIKQEQKKTAATVRKMQFKLEQATADIESAKLRLSSLYSLLDVAMNNQASQIPGSPSDYRYAKQIASLQHSISIAEKQLNTAQFNHAEATIGISQAA